jgi:hypothetical protein
MSDMNATLRILEWAKRNDFVLEHNDETSIEDLLNQIVSQAYDRGYDCGSGEW